MEGRPLDGIVVLDLTRVLAGPYTTMLLNDLGAEIIKVEHPENGDDSRQFGPFINGKSAYFISLNRGKKSITLNLKQEEEKQIFLDLIKKVDILVENYRPGTMEKLGLGYQVLAEINPKLIYAAISGFGHSGPASKKAAYDMIVQAAGGIMSITGEEGRPPVRVGASIGDITAALFAANGILAALYQRKITNRGQKVDIAMFDSQVAILENAIVRYQVSGKIPGPLGSRHPSITPFEAFRAEDDWVIIAIGNDRLWERFCRVVGREELSSDPRFATNGARTEHYLQIKPLMDEIVGRYRSEELLNLLTEHDIPAGPINTVDRLFADSQIKARNMLIEVDDPVTGPLTIAGNPIKMSSLPDSPVRTRAPQLGEHTEEILNKFLEGRGK